MYNNCEASFSVFTCSFTCNCTRPVVAHILNAFLILSGQIRIICEMPLTNNVIRQIHDCVDHTDRSNIHKWLRVPEFNTSVKPVIITWLSSKNTRLNSHFLSYVLPNSLHHQFTIKESWIKVVFLNLLKPSLCIFFLLTCNTRATITVSF